ncbi:hypothetical protein PIB30_027796 [Stylosanthes scabra]|uniref:Uncharacterized protein n=1 Tax=Stylosanthes scabra TaxID=79078 RepID=A0ABU6RB31_9FABA|nr:hypothetical protein [Stylosanthes scabra]
MATSADHLNGNPALHDIDEEAVIVLVLSDITEGIEHCSKSLLGRILADRSFSAGTIETSLTSIWCHTKEHFKTKELGCKSGSSFGEVLEADVFLVRGKENSIVKARVNLNVTKPLRRFEIAVFKSKSRLKVMPKQRNGGEWLRSEQGGKQENMMKENSNPNTITSEQSQQPYGRKPIPVNLIKDLASLSVQSKKSSTARGRRGDE